MIREFLPTDSPLLRLRASSVEIFSTQALNVLVADMFETMRAGRGVGLAAPQIGVSQRIIVFEFSENDRLPGEPSIPPTALINPIITSAKGAADGKEGCFSVPEMIGVITRYEEISYIAQDIEGRRVEGAARGFHARIIQHEVDHLDGILYIDKAKEVEPYKRELG